MAKSKTIRVTPNVKKCLAALQKAVAALPAGELKKRAKEALSYLDKAFSGRPQPLKGRHCPKNTGII